MNLEIDPRRLESSGDVDLEVEDVEEVAAEHRTLLAQTAKLFLDRITDPIVLAQMPREIRAIAHHTAQAGKKIHADSWTVLVGGFIMLRIFSPCMVTPESFDLMPPDHVPSPKARRNLILLAKLIQNCANRVLFGGKEAYMICMNDFIEDNATQMDQYLSEVCNDPMADKNGTEPFADLENLKPNINVNVQEMNIHDLFDFHRILSRGTNELQAFLSTERKNLTGEPTINNTLTALLGELGPAPFVSSVRTKTPLHVDAFLSNLSEDVPNSSGTLIASSAQHDDLIETQALEKARFLFVGPPTKDNNPVVWLIVNRVKLEFLTNINRLVTHVFKIMEEVSKSRYVFIIDMSWATITDEMKTAIAENIPKMFSTFGRNYKKNLSEAYVVHPTAYTSALLTLIRSFASQKLRSKIHDVYNWKDLMSIIPLENILLPEASRSFITKSFQVSKVNAKGKSQTRLIKFTPKSLLNIDPKTKNIQNERPLTEIEDVSAYFNSNEICIRFCENNPKEGKKSILKSITSNTMDSVFRRYVCESKQERDEIIESIFMCGFKYDTINFSTEFKVVKVNHAGKRQDRIFKLTTDSLLNCDESKIQSEISFSGIEEVSLDQDNPNDVLWLKFKSERKKRKIICVENARTMVSTH
eukprot:TRINITY_DN997_c0_g1_i7.p1 TRINITY_DN997_c0_g1~~TRINITY_DN997_c0_g1_i7.p1  ORF type:complete len:642 (+),score=119.86 TRINITY_DN997_c0_g1_i7:610-2535(+)